MDNWHMIAKRHRTKKRGVYYVEREDGTRSYIATWKESVPLNVTDPLTTTRGRVERYAATFDDACRLKAEGETAERKRRSRGFFTRPGERMGERFMALKWFEYRGRR